MPNIQEYQASHQPKLSREHLPNLPPELFLLLLCLHMQWLFALGLGLDKTVDSVDKPGQSGPQTLTFLENDRLHPNDPTDFADRFGCEIRVRSRLNAVDIPDHLVDIGQADAVQWTNFIQDVLVELGFGERAWPVHRLYSQSTLQTFQGVLAHVDERHKLYVPNFQVDLAPTTVAEVARFYSTLAHEAGHLAAHNLPLLEAYDGEWLPVRAVVESTAQVFSLEALASVALSQPDTPYGYWARLAFYARLESIVRMANLFVPQLQQQPDSEPESEAAHSFDSENLQREWVYGQLPLQMLIAAFEQPSDAYRLNLVEWFGLMAELPFDGRPSFDLHYTEQLLLSDPDLAASCLAISS